MSVYLSLMYHGLIKYCSMLTLRSSTTACADNIDLGEEVSGVFER